MLYNYASAAIMSNCTIGTSRQKVQDAREQAYGNNLDLMAQGVNKRKRIANLLGFDSYADYVTSSRMTGSEKAIVDFLGALAKKLETSAKGELAKLVELK